MSFHLLLLLRVFCLHLPLSVECKNERKWAQLISNWMSQLTTYNRSYLAALCCFHIQRRVFSSLSKIRIRQLRIRPPPSPSVYSARLIKREKRACVQMFHYFVVFVSREEGQSLNKLPFVQLKLKGETTRSTRMTRCYWDGMSISFGKFSAKRYIYRSRLAFARK